MISQRFSCSLCGECCSGSMRVFLNSYDLYKICRFLKEKHTTALFERQLVEWGEGQNGLKLLKIRFKSHPFPFCPFLINNFQEETGLRGLCSLHADHKPLICKLAPLTRELDLDTGEDKFGFIPPHADCPGCGRGDPVDKGSVKRDLQEELNYETAYYRLLREYAEKKTGDLREPFLFSPDRPFQEILNDLAL